VSTAPSLTPLRSRRASGDPSQGALDAGRPLGVYVHFPFCSVHCPYCDFAVELRAEIPHDRYADAVLAELEARAAWFRPGQRHAPRCARSTSAVGTPGCGARRARRVSQGVRRAFDAPAAALEITVEANPGEVDEARLRGAAAARGVNRLSLGRSSLRRPAPPTAIGRNPDGASIAPRRGGGARGGGSPT
jgi:oxygen-independent coproporphyrinogen-3 oxidase